MTRSRASAKQAGTRFETLVSEFLAEMLEDDRIERRARNGSQDRGDITGVRVDNSQRVVIECKDYGGRVEVGKWLTEAETERINDDAAVAIVIAKRRGTTKPGEQIAFMDLDTLAYLLGLSQRKGKQ